MEILDDTFFTKICNAGSVGGTERFGPETLGAHKIRTEVSDHS